MEITSIYEERCRRHCMQIKNYSIRAFRPTNYFRFFTPFEFIRIIRTIEFLHYTFIYFFFECGFCGILMNYEG